jgi:hypothetical protein
MVTIENYNNGYRLKFSNPGTGTRGFSVKAADLTEVKIALDHYYDKPTHAASNCPLCREVERDERRPSARVRSG